MVRVFFLAVLLGLCAVVASAQQADTTAVKQQADTTATAVKQQADSTAATVKQPAAPAAVVAPTVAPPQTTPPATTPPPQTTPPPAEPPKTTQPGPKKIYYGGTVGMSFGDYTRVSIVPFVGYKLKPRVHVGGKVGYEYIDGDGYTSHNYGGSLFSRLLVSPRLYAHGEFAYFSYKYSASGLETDRFWVPFLYLGGGLVQPMGRNASAYVEVLFDVLQDDQSPYEDWEPFISVGVGVGF